MDNGLEPVIKRGELALAPDLPGVQQVRSRVDRLARARLPAHLIVKFALRTRTAALMALPEERLDTWDERQVRHALLYVLEAAEGSLRDAGLVALEAALGAQTTL